MRFRYKLWLSAVLVLFGAVTTALAGVPNLINYQGILLDDAGDPVTTPVNVIFAIWDAATDGDSLWSEQQAVSPDGQGRFDVLLGSVSPIPSSAFAGTNVYLSVKVGADPEMVPRSRVVSVGYAYRVATVDGTTGGTISGNVAIQSNLDVNGDLRATGKGTIGPGHTNTGNYAFVAGYSNTASGFRTTVGGGAQNIASNDFATVGGGYFNTASGPHAAVGGGYENTASEWHATVGGGRYNAATHRYATVGGGIYDTASGTNATIAGGRENLASGEHATVAGGRMNTASGDSATVGGGAGNTASGTNSTVPGGAYNLAQGDYSFAAGRRAKANHDGCFVWADATNADFPTYISNVFLIRATNGFYSEANNVGAGGSFYNGGGGDGIEAFANTSAGYNWGALYAINNGTSPGIYAWSSGGPAAYLNGPVTVTGFLTKSGGGFKIDHPLDPENKYLVHSFVESPDMMNVYNGNVSLDANGEAMVYLLDYFEVLNRDFRYQLTAIGAPGPNLYIAEEISDNHFRIAGGTPGMKVSWQVTGIRQDKFAQANPISVEEEKPPEERGKYLHPKAFDLPEAMGIGYEAKMMKMREVEARTR